MLILEFGGILELLGIGGILKQVWVYKSFFLGLWSILAILEFLGILVIFEAIREYFGIFLFFVLGCPSHFGEWLRIFEILWGQILFQIQEI